MNKMILIKLKSYFLEYLLMKTKQLRDNYQQQKYRENSSSDRVGKEVGHKVSLELAVVAMEHTAGPKPIDSAKKDLNQPSNFQMVNKETNRIYHRETDQKVIECIENQCETFKVTQKEGQRIEQIHKNAPGSSYGDTIKKACDNARYGDGAKVIDHRKAEFKYD